MGGPFRVLWVQLVALALGLLIVALGWWLWRVARRGGRAGRTPHCARCDYNLTGLVPRPRDAVGETSTGTDPVASDAPATADPAASDAPATRADPPPAATSAPAPRGRCPECGADLALPRAVLVGRRTPRRILLAASVVTVFVGFGVTAVFSYRVVRYTNWYAYRPTAWVFADAESSEDARVVRALYELAHRERTSRLSSANLRRLAVLLLRVQGAPKLPGDRLAPGAWFDALGRLADAGVLTADQVEQMRQQSAQVGLRVRARALAGRPVPIELGVETRAERDRPINASAVLFVDGRKAAAYTGLVPGAHAFRSYPRLSFHALDPQPPGAHTVRAVFDVALHEPIRVDIADRPGSDPLVLHLSREAATEIVVGEPADLVRIVTDPASDPQLNGQFSVMQALVIPETDPKTGERGLGFRTDLVCQGDLKVAVAFELVLAWDGTRTRVGRGAFAPTRHDMPRAHRAFTSRIPPDTPERVTLILEPSLEAALETVDVDAIWHAPITLGPVTILNHATSVRNLREEREIEARAAQTQPAEP